MEKLKHTNTPRPGVSIPKKEMMSDMGKGPQEKCLLRCSTDSKQFKNNATTQQTGKLCCSYTTEHSEWVFLLFHF